MHIKYLFCCAFLFGVLSTKAMAQNPIKVDVMYPQQMQKSQNIQLPGTVQAKQNAQLASLEAGRVASLTVEVGDVVSKGQVLLNLDNQLAKLEVAGAAAEVKAAELNLQEAKRLYEEVAKLSAQQVVAKTLIAERAALLANAEVELARVKANHNLQQERLKRHSLQAPFAGVVAVRNVDVGEWVTPQNAVLTLVAQSDLRLSIEIPQQYYNALRETHQVQVTVIPDTDGVDPIAANLSRLVPVSNFQTRTFTAQIDLPDSLSTGLVVGMSATAELTFPDSAQAAIILPRAAIKQHPDGNSSVFTVVNNRAKRVVTQYTNMPDDRVAIYGQPANQPYIISGVELLREGAVLDINEVQDTGQ
ncbi:efflux RND transporter periplasmic adaptor subunit [Marinicella sp. W31]|uniref:efflux RND transporter periplasmic adaptor subunit n=1 Tax=Marinicella sp. W31 TaxID=3023713 RepID=UPI00375810B2